MSTLNPDCLHQVFRFLHVTNPWLHGGYPCDRLRRRGRYQDLRSCALVSRSWCDVAVPLLWNHPFDVVQGTDQMRALFGVVVQCLLQRPDGPQFASFFESHSIRVAHELRSRLCTYDYVSFVGSLCYYNLKACIHVWMESNRLANGPDWHMRLYSTFSHIRSFLTTFTSSTLSSLLSQSSPTISTQSCTKPSAMLFPTPSSDGVVANVIASHVINASTRLGVFAVRPHDGETLPADWKTGASAATVSLATTVTASTLEHLVQVTWNVSTHTTVAAAPLRAMAKVCRRLEFICVVGTIDNTFDDHERDPVAVELDCAVADLIGAQRWLVGLNLERSGIGWHRAVDALRTQTRSLKSVRFWKVLFSARHPLNALAECERLEYLGFEKCAQMIVPVLAPLIDARFPHLNHLGFFYTDTSHTVIQAMVSKARSTLRSLYFSVRPETLKTVALNVTNLSVLHLSITRAHAREFNNLLAATARQLTYMAVVAGDFDPSTNWVLDMMRTYEYPKLESLSIECLVKCSSTSLNRFFIDCRLPVIANFMFIMWFVPTNDHLDHVRRWTSRKRLSELRIMCSSAYVWRTQLLNSLAEAADIFLYNTVD